MHHILRRTIHNCIRVCVLALTVNSVNVFADGFTQNWNGWYTGVQGGKGSSRFNWKFQNPNYFNTLGSAIVGNTFNQSSNGYVTGVDMGFNFQPGTLVYGLHGMYLNTNMDTTINSPFFPATDTFSTNIRSLATLAGRLGYAFVQWMPYLSGGYAGGNVRLRINDMPNNIGASNSQWTNGWTLGAGIDFHMASRTSIGLAYDYIRLKVNNRTLSCPNCGSGIGLGTPVVDGTIQTKILTVKYNYHF